MNVELGWQGLAHITFNRHDLHDVPTLSYRDILGHCRQTRCLHEIALLPTAGAAVRLLSPRALVPTAIRNQRRASEPWRREQRFPALDELQHRFRDSELDEQKVESEHNTGSVVHSGKYSPSDISLKALSTLGMQSGIGDMLEPTMWTRRHLSRYGVYRDC